MFKKHVLPAIGDWELAELTPDPLQRLLNQIASRGYRKSMVQHIRTYVRAALEYAVDEGLLGRNPRMVKILIKRRAIDRSRLAGVVMRRACST
jgi:hypothetical protein